MNSDQAVAMALSGIGPESRSAFAHNPFGVLPHLGFTARPVAALGDGVRNNGSSCHGMSFLDGGVIMYAPSPHSRRENFTVAHEIGHFLVARQEDILDWLGDLSDPKRALETVCDRIASELLLPGTLINQVTGGQAPLAEHVIALFEASNASEPCCAIALANQLPVMGAVVIARRDDQTVRHASIRPFTDGRWPDVYPRPGERVPSGRFRLQPDRTADRGYFWWVDQRGRTLGYFADAYGTHNRVYLVMAEADLWNGQR